MVGEISRMFCQMASGRFLKRPSVVVPEKAFEARYGSEFSKAGEDAQRRILADIRSR